LDAALAQTPANFWSKTLFSGKLVPNPICVPNLKLLASTKYVGGPKFYLDAPLAQTPPILVQNVFFVS